MSFTTRDILNTAEIYYGESIDDSTAIYAVNRALGLIADKAQYHTTVTITPTDTDAFNTTNASCTSIVWVRDSESNTYYGWESYDPRSIRFDDLDTYTVLIRCMPTEISGLDTTINLHPIYEQPLVTYLIGFSKLADDDMNPDGQQKLEKEFIVDAGNAAATLARKYSPAQMKVIR